jgi:YihY family inner membrane protein
LSRAILEEAAFAQFVFTEQLGLNDPGQEEQQLAEVLNSSATGDPVIEQVDAVDVVEPAKQSKWYRWRRSGVALISYLMDSEVHTFAFSVAANAILSFIPFIVLLYTLAYSVFRSDAMVKVVDYTVNYFLPPVTKEKGWITGSILNMVKSSPHHGVQVFSLIMIVIACTGIFLPLEVALNQAWGVTKSRNYLHNQVIAFGLAILMVALGMGSVLLNEGVRELLTLVFFMHTDNFVFNGICLLVVAATTSVASILFFFSIYWILPNRKIPWRPVFRTAVVTGIIWLIAKYIFIAILPHLDLESLYGPFYVSVGLLFWAYASGLILFAGAQFSVARWGQKKD